MVKQTLIFQKSIPPPTQLFLTENDFKNIDVLNSN